MDSWQDGSPDRKFTWFYVFFSESAAKIYILGTDIQTIIVFLLKEGPGSLFKALAVLALLQINLAMIESRPLRRRHIQGSNDNSNGSPKYFDCLFFMDFEVSMAGENAQNVLGSYPVDASMI